MRHRIACLFLLVCFFITPVSFADSTLTRRPEVQAFITDMVKHHGFQRAALTTAFNKVTLQPQIIESMERPYEKKTWDVYKNLFLTPQRLNEGIVFWQDNQALLAKAEQRFGVPAAIIVAILGVETLYGKHQGNYRVIDALSTLAFNYPKRSAFFKKELSEYLLLCREHGVLPDRYMGSYAGAMGKPQFMPSSYRYYAASFNAKPHKDLMNDNEAVIASVANYFHKHGWKLHAGIAQPAVIKTSALHRIHTDNRKAQYTLSQLMSAGVRPVTPSINQPKEAGLIQLTTSAGPEYWITYPNFYVITRYNTSPQYALAVYLLAEQLKRQWAVRTARKFAYA